MKRFFTYTLFVIIFYNCKEVYQPRVIESVVIQQFDIDSISIRTIQVVDANKVYFAGSKGTWGRIENDQVVRYTIAYQDSIIPAFRSMTSNGTDLFMLSIANPALLYKIEGDTPTLVYKEEHEAVFYDSMKFFDAQNGIAMGDPTEDCLSILLTKDGGASWTKIPCEKLPKAFKGEAAFAASNTNIKVLGSTAWIVTGGLKARVFKTTDMGATWEVYDTPIMQGISTRGIYSVDFVDQNNGIVFGGDYSKPDKNSANKAVTIDGGKTWTLVANRQYPNYKSCVQYVPNTQGKEVFAVGKTGISYSNDGGHTWKEVSKEPYYTIQFVDRNTAWLSGYQKMGKLRLE